MEHPTEIVKQTLYQALIKSNLLGIHIGMTRAQLFSVIGGLALRGPILELYVLRPHNHYNIFVRFDENDRICKIVTSIINTFDFYTPHVLDFLTDPIINGIAIPIGTKKRIMNIDVVLCLGNNVVIDVVYQSKRLRRLSILGQCDINSAFVYANDVATQYLNRNK